MYRSGKEALKAFNSEAKSKEVKKLLYLLESSFHRIGAKDR